MHKRGKNLEELKADLMARGRITEKSWEKARRELDADPEWQAFLAAQPKPQAA